jgi:hypothetical protein
MLRDIAVALYWTQFAALGSALLGALGWYNLSPMLGLVSYFLIRELSELLMALHYRDNPEEEEE